jgi:hypothetical protein
MEIEKGKKRGRLKFIGANRAGVECITSWFIKKAALNR